MNKIWSVHHREIIEKGIQQAKRNNAHPFAVFDADNTIWKHDLVEGLIGWMSIQGLLRLRELQPSIVPYPIRNNDTMLSYYTYLCDIDHAVGYLFACQVFAGFTLGELRVQLDAMMSSVEPMRVPMPDGYAIVHKPNIFPAQRSLIHFLQEEGVEVWIVSASLEELVRMVASDPKYGIGLPPEQVIGVNLIMHSPDSEVFVGALERKAGQQGNKYYFSEERMQCRLSSIPWTPLTWYGGKLAAILESIDPAQKPILVAGDSPNDFIMQFHVAAESGGIRLRIHRNTGHKRAWAQEVERQERGNISQAPRLGWLEVTSAMLGIPDDEPIGSYSIP